MLSRAGGLPPEERATATDALADAAAPLARTRDELFLLPFEPRWQRPSRGEVRRFADLIDETGALLSLVAVSTHGGEDLRRQNERVTDTLRLRTIFPQEGSAGDPSATPPEIAQRLGRVERLVTQ